VHSKSACAAILALVIGIAGIIEPRTAAQSYADSRVVAAVDRVYPGFMEILERDDPTGLVLLARALTRDPSVESLTVLFWMLERCPSWTSQEFSSAIRRAIRTVGTVPGSAAASALRRGTPHHRLMLAFTLIETQ
jgi:hypothetical protein